MRWSFGLGVAPVDGWSEMRRAKESIEMEDWRCPRLRKNGKIQDDGDAQVSCGKGVEGLGVANAMVNSVAAPLL
jgi:hypothetical protein